MDKASSPASKDSTSDKHQIEPVALRINDAAAACGLGRTSIYELINEGKLRTVKVAGRRLVPMAALRELIEHAA